MNNLKKIADNVVVNGDVDAVKALPDLHLTRLHFLVTKRLKVAQKFTKDIQDNITVYVNSLVRFHKALFWKIFNKFAEARSKMWYLSNEYRTRIILYSLACWADKKSQEYWAQVQSLDAVFEYQFN